MSAVDPLTIIEHAGLVLDDGRWPNFHDAEIHALKVWRGDVRPEDDVWIGPVIEAAFELCALREPYIARLKFHDCNEIRLQPFDRDSAVYDLHFAHEARGFYTNGEPLPPAIRVRFVQAFDVELSFTRMRVQAVGRVAPGTMVGRPFT